MADTRLERKFQPTGTYLPIFKDRDDVEFSDDDSENDEFNDDDDDDDDNDNDDRSKPKVPADDSGIQDTSGNLNDSMASMNLQLSESDEEEVPNSNQREEMQTGNKNALPQNYNYIYPPGLLF